MNTGELLKRRIPEFQQGDTPLASYLEAAGEFLDGAKEAIVNLDNLHDYKNSTEFFYENTLEDRGYALPSRMVDEEKRRILQDLSEIHRKCGTLDGIIHAIRMAGIIPSIRIGWLPSPTTVKKGYIVDPVTKVESRYDVNRYVYTKMMYGDIKNTQEGTFFYGYRYEDTFSENEIGPLPIMGERYTEIPSNGVSVAKTPYIIVNFQEGNRTIATDPVVDPETGEVYAYSSSEQFELLNDILEFFLVKKHRPSTMRIIIIVSLQPLVEEMAIDVSEYAETHTYTPDGGDLLTDSVAISNVLVCGGRYESLQYVVGDNVLIGTHTPYRSRFFVVSNLTIGGSPRVNAQDLNSWGAVTGQGIHPEGANVFEHPAMGGCSFTLTPTAPLSVYGYRGNVVADKQLIQTISSGATATITPSLEFDVVRFEYQTPLASDVVVQFNYQAVDRG